MPSTASTTPVPACPRCGYDQSGEIARWATPQQGDAAPATPAAPPTPPTATGRCTECGLEFLWADVLEPERRYLPGFFEHARGVPEMIVWAWRTWWWTIFPSRFWARVRLQHDAHPIRAFLWIPVLWLGAWWLVAIQRVIFALRWNGWNGATLSSAISAWHHQVWWELAWPIAAYNRHSASWVNGASGDPGIFQWRTWPVFSPMIFSVPLGVWSAVLANAGFALMLSVLPHTRAKAKLQPAHIWRGFAFGWSWLGLGMIVLALESATVIAQSLQGKRYWTDAYLLDQLFAGGSWFVLLWLCEWWRCAIKIGYRIERYRVVWLAAAVPVALAVFVLRTYAFAYFAR